MSVYMFSQAVETDPAPEPVSGQQASSGEAAATDRTLKQGQLATGHKRRGALQRVDKATAGGTLKQGQSASRKERQGVPQRRGKTTLAGAARKPGQRSIEESFNRQQGNLLQSSNNPPTEPRSVPAEVDEDTQNVPLRKAVFDIEIQANGIGMPRTKCAACDQWGATYRVCRGKDGGKHQAQCGHPLWRWIYGMTGGGYKRNYGPS